MQLSAFTRQLFDEARIDFFASMTSGSLLTADSRSPRAFSFSYAAISNFNSAGRSGSSRRPGAVVAACSVRGRGHSRFVCPDLGTLAPLNARRRQSLVIARSSRCRSGSPVVSPQFRTLRRISGLVAACVVAVVSIAARPPKNNPNMIFLPFIAVSPLPLFRFVKHRLPNKVLLHDIIFQCESHTSFM